MVHRGSLLQYNTAKYIIACEIYDLNKSIYRFHIVSMIGIQLKDSNLSYLDSAQQFPIVNLPTLFCFMNEIIVKKCY